MCQTYVWVEPPAPSFFDRFPVMAWLIWTRVVGARGRDFRVTDLKSLSPPPRGFESRSGQDFIVGRFSSWSAVLRWLYPDICLTHDWGLPSKLDVAIMTYCVAAMYFEKRKKNEHVLGLFTAGYLCNSFVTKLRQVNICDAYPPTLHHHSRHPPQTTSFDFSIIRASKIEYNE